MLRTERRNNRMATKEKINHKKPVHNYDVEFRRYGKYVSENVYVVAYSPKQAKKFFYDWWKNHHNDYAIIIMVSQIDDAKARALCSRIENCSLEEKFERQCDYIYRRENNEQK